MRYLSTKEANELGTAVARRFTDGDGDRSISALSRLGPTPLTSGIARRPWSDGTALALSAMVVIVDGHDAAGRVPSRIKTLLPSHMAFTHEWRVL